MEREDHFRVAHKVAILLAIVAERDLTSPLPVRADILDRKRHIAPRMDADRAVATDEALNDRRRLARTPATGNQ